MGELPSRFREVWREIDSRGQIAIVGAVVAALVTGFLLLRFASSTSYATLASNLGASDSGQVTQALESSGIGYRLGSGGTSVSVPEKDLSAARVALARQGLPRGQHVGFELFDKSSLGTSDFQQKVEYQRALEGEVARTIEQVDGVDQAQVQLVLPDESLFADAGEQASAAVLLTTSGLDSATVRGVAHLVASAVKGLAPDAVTITDSTGTLLWPTDAAAGGGAAAATAAEQRYGTQLAAQLNALIASTLGPDKAQARVHAQLSLDQTTIEKVTYGKKSTPLKTQTDVETLKSQGGAGATPSGTKTNVPSYSGAASGSSKSDYSHKTDSSELGVDRTVQKTTVAPGTVQRLDVALLVDQSVPAAQVTALQKAVGGAAGVDPARGDTLTVSKIAFSKQTAAAAAASSPLAMLGDPITVAKTVLAVLGALVFLFLARRGIKKREQEGIVPEPTWLREFAAATPLAELESGPPRLALDPAAERRASTRDELEELARTQPEQVAVQVRQWLKQ